MKEEERWREGTMKGNKDGKERKETIKGRKE